MRKKLQLFIIAITSAISCFSQNPPTLKEACGTSAPPQQWESWMQDKMAEYRANQANAGRLIYTTIPVIVHIIHTGETYPTYPNVDSNEVQSQIDALNNDFSGIGTNASNVPAVFAGLKANTGIHFCLATRDQQDVPLAFRGIDRINANTFNWTSPGTPTLDLQTYFTNVVIPATIWDPTKYLNIWISDKPPTYPLKGFSSYPSGSNLPGIWGGTTNPATTDGVWIYTKAFGTVSNAVAPYNLGRTATHEIGHWLGLRHIWGDGNCLSDYVNDTPWQKQAHYGNPVHPIEIDQCGVNTAPNGALFMDFMDMCDDASRYMFTVEQNIRMQTALSQSPFRNQLGTHGKCDFSPTPTTSSATASFNLAQNQCLNAPFYPTNTSGGFPSPSFLWSSSPAVNFTPNNTVANPGITLTNAGVYTITVVASNSLSSSSYSMQISAYGNCTKLSPCIDTLKAITSTDTLNSIKIANNPNVGGCVSGFAGYMTGTNCYKDKEFAQYFAPNTLTGTPFPQVNSVIVLFDSIGTKAANPGAQISCKIYGGSVTQGPISLITQKNDSLGKIVAMNNKVLSIGYIGSPNVPPVTNSKIIPFRYDFATPVPVNAISGFFVSVQTPTNSLLDSINIFSSNRYSTAPDSSAWFLQYSNSWKPYRTARSAKLHLAIIPIITCSPANGIQENVSSLQSGFMVMPNPGTGTYHMIFSLKQTQDLKMTIRNYMGQELLVSQLNNVTNNVVDLDLTSYPDGIYFAEISGAAEKVVKKIVLKH